MGGTISFCSPNWEINLVRSKTVFDQKIELTSFCEWLKIEGFLQQKDKSYFTREPIEVFVYSDQDEVVFLTIDFPPVDDAMEQISNWEIFCRNLCSQWGFELIDSVNARKAGAEHFRKLLSMDKIWQLISKLNGWPQL